jgi:hypothetical protein
MAERGVDTTDILTNIGILVGTASAAWIAYKTKNPEKPPPLANAIVSGIGLEIGNKDQTDRKQEAIEDKLDELIERMEKEERRN